MRLAITYELNKSLYLVQIWVVVWSIFTLILLAGFGIEAVCFIALGFITNINVVMIVMCVGVAFSGLAISGIVLDKSL